MYVTKEKMNFHKIFIDRIQNIKTIEVFCIAVLVTERNTLEEGNISLSLESYFLSSK